jgi:hypothetical protein
MLSRSNISPSNTAEEKLLIFFFIEHYLKRSLYLSVLRAASPLSNIFVLLPNFSVFTRKMYVLVLVKSCQQVQFGDHLSSWF